MSPARCGTAPHTALVARTPAWPSCYLGYAFAFITSPESDVLPKTYNALEKNLLISLLKNFSSIPHTDARASCGVSAFGVLRNFRG